MTNKNIILTFLLFFLILIEILVALDYIAQHKRLNKKRSSAYNSILELSNQIGYNGLIHNFKNHILRFNESTYRERTIKNYKIAKRKIETIESYAKMTIQSNYEMTNTRHMLESYRERLDRISSLFNEGLQANEVDRLVRFDDNPAYDEIENTSKLLIKSIDAEIYDALNKSLSTAFALLLLILATVASLIIFFANEQKKALKDSHRKNIEINNQKNRIAASNHILISITQDIREEKEKAKAANHKLIRKNQEMERFIYTVSHDLKSPLVTIGGFSKKLADELHGQISEKQMYRLNRIQGNVNEMEALLKDLLELSRITLKPIEKSFVNIDTLIDKQCKVLEEAIRSSHAKIIIKEPLGAVYANERLLAQCVSNITTNAIRYRKVSRPLEITISTTRSELSTSIHIKDNGTGIDKKYHEIIFGIFERLSTIEGTGIGLTIVKTIMEKHEGAVTLESEIDEGSCFSLTFPNKIDYEVKI